MDQMFIDFLTTSTEIIVGLAFGLALLLFGRRLFWLMGGLAVALLALVLVGLAMALVLMGNLNLNASDGDAVYFLDLPNALAGYGPVFVMALVVGVIGGAIGGALLMLRAPRAAATIVGLVGGGLLTMIAFQLYRIDFPIWLDFVVALAIGIATAVVAHRNPDTALIVLTTLLGTTMIISAVRLNLNSSISAIIWLSLMLLGILYQTYALRKREAKARLALAKAKPAAVARR